MAFGEKRIQHCHAFWGLRVDNIRGFCNGCETDHLFVLQTQRMEVMTEVIRKSGRANSKVLAAKCNWMFELTTCTALAVSAAIAAGLRNSAAPRFSSAQFCNVATS